VKEILVISGKGGTGKTVVTGAFAALTENKVMADCDVDAADLHLLLRPSVRERHAFTNGKTAFIDKKLCNLCGGCIAICRFDAIYESFTVDPVSCEGCALCSRICPEGAIRMVKNKTGEWFVSDTRFGPMVHAKLGIGEENSGKLVSLVKKKARKLAEEKGCDWLIVDGAPGIGCPVIASLSGVDCALVVTEPTISGLHDADRVIGVARHFGVRVKVAVNKYDLNIDMTKKIESYCKKNKIPLAGTIPFDKAVIKSVINAETIMEHKGAKAKKEIVHIWKEIAS